MVDNPSYEAAAAEAMANPRTRVTLRVGMATANLVTNIRKGGISALPPKLFQARATRVLTNDKVTYDIDVMYVPPQSGTPEAEQEDIVTSIIDRIRPIIQQHVAPDQDASDTVDGLPPTQYLIMEVLAARARLGESIWPFPTSVIAAGRSLEQRGLVQLHSGQVEKSFRLSLTEKGKAGVLSGNYRTPLEQIIDDELPPELDEG